MSSLLRISVFLVLIGASSTLFAYWPYGCYCDSPYIGGIYSLNDVPYFAANPPVYYSKIVTRPYGWSPFPYPLDSIYFHDEAESQPRVIVNQFVNQENPASVSAVQPRLPLRIVNPFVTQANGDKSAK
jgi:hypothetical protein